MYIYYKNTYWVLFFYDLSKSRTIKISISHIYPGFPRPWESWFFKDKNRGFWNQDKKDHDNVFIDKVFKVLMFVCLILNNFK